LLANGRFIDASAGAERAVGFAMGGEAWRFDVREEAEALFFGAARR